MSQRYKVFISDTPVIFLQNEDFIHDGVEFHLALKYSGLQDIEWIYSHLDILTKVKKLYVLCDSVEDVWTDFKNFHQIIEAAGGILRNNNGEVLFILRNSIWDLPKGKIEKGESREEAAVREVEEECGLSGIELQSFFETSFHSYFHKEKWVLKPTYWYNMTIGDDSQKGKAQEEEGITEMAWKSSKWMEELRENSFKSIIDLAEKAFS